MVLFTLTVVVICLIAWVIWAARHAHIEALRAIAYQPWDAPEQLWTCPAVAGVSVGGPEGPVIELVAVDGDDDDSCCGRSDGPEWFRVTTRACADARRALGAESVHHNDPVYDRACGSCVFNRRRWRRWDLRHEDR